MAHTHIPYIPIFEGDEDPRCHYFIFETIWDATSITKKNKKIVEFTGSLRKKSLTWYMNFNENQEKFKNDIR